MKKQQFQMGHYYKLSVVEFNHDNFHIAILYNAFPSTTPEDWQIDYDMHNQIFGRMDIVEVESKMQVYATLKQIEEYMLEEHRSIMTPYTREW